MKVFERINIVRLVPIWAFEGLDQCPPCTGDIGKKNWPRKTNRAGGSPPDHHAFERQRVGNNCPMSPQRGMYPPKTMPHHDPKPRINRHLFSTCKFSSHFRHFFLRKISTKVAACTSKFYCFLPSQTNWLLFLVLTKKKLRMAGEAAVMSDVETQRCCP